MKAAADVFSDRVRRVLLWQAATACAVGCASAALVSGPPLSARLMAALAGGGIAMAGTLILGHSLARADGKDGAAGQLWLYGGFVLRFLLALALLFVALGVLHLPGVPLVAAFGFGQLMYAMPGGRAP